MWWPLLLLYFSIASSAPSLQDPVWPCSTCVCPDDGEVEVKVCKRPNGEYEATSNADGQKHSEIVDGGSRTHVQWNFPSGGVEAYPDPSNPPNDDWEFVYLSRNRVTLKIRCNLP